MKIRSKLTVAIALGALIAGGSVSAASAASSAPLSTQSVAGVTVKNAPQIKSEAALTAYIATTRTAITQDASTGEILTVTANPVTTQASTRNVCQAGDAYWASAGTPYANNCFYGSAGTVALSGTPTQTLFTGGYTARGSYTYQGVTRVTVKQAPGSSTTLTAIARSVSGTIF